MFRLRISARTLLALLGTLMALLVAVPASAQTTGALRVYVTDEYGDPIPTASTTISSEYLIGGAQERLTDGEGSALFVELPPGLYEVVVVKSGFATTRYTDVQVNINRTVTRTVVMPLGAPEEEIEVVATRSAVEVENTTIGQVLDKEFLQRIPTGRSYQSAVQMASGVQAGTGGNPNIAGAATNENTYMLDGATITDPVTGTFSLNFNYDAIQQIEVLLGGYEPEYGVSLGGIVNIVTDSGTNNLEFNTSVYYQNGAWAYKKDARYTADGFQLAPTGFDSVFQTFSVGGLVSGPIIRDRAWFFISYQHQRSLIANTGIPQRRDYDAHYLLAKLTVQPNAEHRITAFVQLQPTTIDNAVQSDPYQKRDAQARQAQGGIVAQARWQWFLSQKANLDTKFLLQKNYIEVSGVPCTHNRNSDFHPCKPGEEEGEIDWYTPGRVGFSGAYNSSNYDHYDLDDRLRYQGSIRFSLLEIKDPFGGKHDFKFGTEGIQLIHDRIIGYFGNTLYYDIDESPFDPDTYENYYWVEASGPAKYRGTGSQWNFFLQDAWKPIANLTFKYGVRFDRSILRNDQGEPVLLGNVWGPRVYAAWDPFNDQKTKIAGGYGRFNDTGRIEVSHQTSEAALGSKLYVGEYFGQFGGIDPGTGYNNFQSVMYSIGTRVNTSTALDTIRLPRSDEFTFLFQRQLVTDVALGVNGTAKYTRYLYEPDETNLIYDEDGTSIIGARNGNTQISYSRLRSPLRARRDYYRADVYLDKVATKRWGGRITYSYTYSRGSSEESLSGSFMNDPQTQYNYGRLFTNTPHQVKAYGFWDIPNDPWTTTLGFNFTFQSGEPLERRYPMEGLGGYGLRIRSRGVYTTFNSWSSLDLSIQQSFDVRRGQLKASLQVFNVLNQQAPWSLSRTYLYQQNRLFALSRQDPLSVLLGITYNY